MAFWGARRYNASCAPVEFAKVRNKNPTVAAIRGINHIPASLLARRASCAHVLTIAMGQLASTGALQASAAVITVNASKQPAGNPHFWFSTVGTGAAKLTNNAGKRATLLPCGHAQGCLQCLQAAR